MCMDSGPFLLVCGDREESLAEVNAIIAGDNGLKLVDVFGKSREIPGRIIEVDLLNSRIVVG